LVCICVSDICSIFPERISISPAPPSVDPTAEQALISTVINVTDSQDRITFIAMHLVIGI
jgi:hypothetical protein